MATENSVSSNYVGEGTWKTREFDSNGTGSIDKASLVDASREMVGLVSEGDSDVTIYEQSWSGSLAVVPVMQSADLRDPVMFLFSGDLPITLHAHRN